MKAALLKKIHNIEIEEIPIRKLNENELLIKIDNCGFCGTDRLIYEGKAPAKLPVVLGHEFSGIIADNSKCKQDFSIGQKVVVDPNIYCGYCQYCKEGKIQFCENLEALGVTQNGGFADYTIVPAAQIYSLPDDFDLSEASFAEPVSCCLRGINRADITPGETVVVIGGGTIGQLMVQLSKLTGATKIVLIEPLSSKRELASSLGADYTLDPLSKDFYEEFNDITKSTVDVMIECVGQENAAELTFKIAKKGARIVLFGLAPHDHKVELNLQYLFEKELSIHFSYLNPYLFSKAVNLIINRRLKLKSLISKYISLVKINDILTNNIDSQVVKYQIIT